MPCEIRIIRWHKLRYNIIYEYIKQIAWKQLYRDKHTLLKSNHLGKNNAEAIIQNTQFASTKALTIANCQSEFCRLVWQD